MRRLMPLIFCIALVACGTAQNPHTVTQNATTASSAAASDRPVSRITPGKVITTDARSVCTAGWASAHRHSLTTSQESGLLKAYGYSIGTKVAEWDHLISLELGGDNGIQNIWPQVIAADKSRKDTLENSLHGQVCSGKLSLTTAQKRIVQYWLWW